MNYITLAKDASLAEQENHWKKAAILWAEAAEKASHTSANYPWALTRVEFCQARDKAVNPMQYS